MVEAQLMVKKRGIANRAGQGFFSKKIVTENAGKQLHYKNMRSTRKCETLSKQKQYFVL